MAGRHAYTATHSPRRKTKEFMSVTLSTLEDALSYLAEYENTQETAPPVVFEGELAQLEIDVEGERYHSSIPAELARGLWEYQEAIYKAVAYTLYGVEDIRRLTMAQREEFELVFEVSKGSTELIAKLKGFIDKLGEGFLTMESKHKAYVLVAITVALATGYTATTIVESQSKVKLDEIKASTQIALDLEKTRQFDVLAKAVNQGAALAFKKASEEGAKAIVGSTPDAKEVKIGRTRINRSDIEEFNQRAVKEKSRAEIVQEDFRVFGTFAKDASATRYILARKDSTEFPVVVSHDDLSSTDIEKIWAAARDRKPISLEVNLTIQRGSIKAAQIVKVL